MGYYVFFSYLYSQVKPHITDMKQYRFYIYFLILGLLLAFNETVISTFTYNNFILISYIILILLTIAVIVVDSIWYILKKISIRSEN